VVLSCLLRKSICGFVSIYPGVSFHSFKFYFLVLFVQGYFSLVFYILICILYINMYFKS
jgi:hypothetical protein